MTDGSEAFAQCLHGDLIDLHVHRQTDEVHDVADYVFRHQNRKIGKVVFKISRYVGFYVSRA